MRTVSLRFAGRKAGEAQTVEPWGLGRCWRVAPTRGEPDQAARQPARPYTFALPLRSRNSPLE
eukprot:5982592-Pyramimonas_sp.AAC.1